MFSGFTMETSEFLWELAFNNERPWFQAHKEQFDRCLGRPFKAVAEETQALMQRRYPAAPWRLHVSRIYRDARRLFGRGPYKDHLWFSLKSGEGPGQGPGFWFEVNAAKFLYGMGIYDMSPTQMEGYRRCIAANPARFERLAREVLRSGHFHVCGEEYKRPKGDLGPVINPWYNRKWVGLEHEADFGGELLSPRLPEILADRFSELMPMYEFFLETYCAAGPKEEPRR